MVELPEHEPLFSCSTTRQLPGSQGKHGKLKLPLAVLALAGSVRTSTKKKALAKAKALFLVELPEHCPPGPLELQLVCPTGLDCLNTHLHINNQKSKRGYPKDLTITMDSCNRAI